MKHILINAMLVSALLGSTALVQAGSFETLTRIPPKIKVIGIPKKRAPTVKSEPAEKEMQKNSTAPAKPATKMQAAKPLPKMTDKKASKGTPDKKLAAKKPEKKMKKMQLRMGQPELPVVKVNGTAAGRSSH